MSHALVDIGNSRIKVVVMPSLSEPFPAAAEIAAFRHDEFTVGQLQNLHHSTCSWTVCSVNREAADRLCSEVLASRPDDAIYVFSNTQLPIEVDVETPQQIGTDRLCGAIAANNLKQKNSPAVVINSGTAVTIDAIAADGTFGGGVIFPGLITSLKSLNLQTSALPDLSSRQLTKPDLPIGKSTEQAMMNGVVLSHIAAVNSIVNQFCDQLVNKPDVFLAGGLSYLVADENSDWQHVPDLVLRGVHLAAIDRS